MEKISFKRISEGLKKNEKKAVMGGCGGWFSTEKQNRGKKFVQQDFV